jgi:hypothetical protein
MQEAGPPSRPASRGPVAPSSPSPLTNVQQQLHSRSNPPAAATLRSSRVGTVLAPPEPQSPRPEAGRGLNGAVAAVLSRGRSSSGKLPGASAPQRQHGSGEHASPQRPGSAGMRIGPPNGSKDGSAGTTPRETSGHVAQVGQSLKAGSGAHLQGGGSLTGSLDAARNDVAASGAPASSQRIGGTSYDGS